ncbi:hypothetical protein HRM2_31470 [Desulforapulum autotrophicum HRM2]|uniref:Alginate export domain-containing protein n=1 Tax=Desulforapulum autotrophicum (strain ATCC 43914 / DSM 3382 / VKM B-1955 / HRM2) TaxID=177437 RepID=C0QKZ0_DESAH|nr:hypothetical protein [Desulforapulum autotrophicum]ACN16230.1 hypothetical protein HRM2_31470 [Desulforapulum autotrophicum HRM2]
MKKMLLVALVAVLGLAFTVPASAFESEFGGYWRTRMFTNDNFSGTDSDSSLDNSKIDTRTRLYYTAVLNDNLKFVNKFEWDTTWGDNVGGDIGTDGKILEIKNSYVDATFGMVNAKIGQQGLVLARGFIFDDDYSGINLTVAGATSLVYMKIDESDTTNMNDDNQAFVVAHAIKGDGFTVTPLALYADLEDSSYTYMIGVDVDANLGAASVWGSFYYEGGNYDPTDVDQSAYLLAVGGNVNLSDMVGLHGQVFYASGDDDPTDDDAEAWTEVGGQSYYWSEIMGFGVFDDVVSNGSPADKVSNITAINLGTTIKASEKLSFDADVWYAMLAEDDVNGEDYLGTEIDLKATYMLIDGLKLEVIAAYLFAGDATYNGSDDDDPLEFGTQLSLSF